MPADQIPDYFYPVFFTAFGINVLYIAAVFLLQFRLRETPHAFKLFGSTPVDLFRMLGFVFSGRHVELQDAATSQSVWLVRVLFFAAMAGTLGVFAMFGGLI